MDLWSKKNTKHNMKHATTKVSSPSVSSDYSTCPDISNGNGNSKDQNLCMSTQSVVLAGGYQTLYQTLDGPKTSNTILDDTNYTVNILDQALYLSNEGDESLIDYTDNNKSEYNDDNTTKYFPLSLDIEKSKNPNFYKNQSDSNISETNTESIYNNLMNISPNIIPCQSEPLLTIVEEKEMTDRNDSIILRADEQNTGEMVAEIVSRIKSAEFVNSINKNSTKRVLFANDNDKQVCPDKLLKIKKRQKTFDPLCKKVGCYTGQKENRIDQNYNNNQNTTESFIYWEKLCQTSRLSTTMRSYSFSELNSVSDSCKGDDEYSTSFKTLDETYVSSYSLESLDNKNVDKKKQYIQRSKSCDSLRKEVKHLPYVLCDQVLKCLVRGIENIRKENQQKMNKETLKKTTKSNASITVKNTNIEVKKKDSKLSFKGSALTVGKTQNKLVPNIMENSSHNNQRLSSKSPNKTLTTIHQNQNRLTPEILKVSSHINQRMSPKSPSKLCTTPKKPGLYTWHKEIVSPVGEYIRGKRQSPFQSSPNKRKM